MKIASLISYIAAGSLASLLVSLLGGSHTAAAYVAFTVSLLGLIVVREYTPRTQFVVTAKPKLRLTSIRRSPRRVAQFKAPAALALAR